ncbi:MAG: T9SS type A sorting domain-containing protein, partial [Ignavibacteriaceae bacterium]|nr:T9SS type A sorting domain-containing protein [Ignavibacteriaceae bacterium]
IGNERDLPSVYLSDNAFKEIYGNDYEGIPVSGGSFKITNSMIIPETESREVETISGTFLFEITINGLLCASIGSHLGLPDLFDTETGLSAIGRFGLMDGQSIFAYLGTYPPEPSPWEKIYLSEKYNWNIPFSTISLENTEVEIVTNLAATLSDTVILKVPLNSSEYYLIENRIRDAYDNGSTITYTIGDVVITKTFPNDTTGYRSFDVDSLSGVIIDVDEFDWAVPGNGIVIWHIDENVINEKISENKVNTDKTRRGVDVEEADGVQDIGEVFYTIFGDQVIGEGFEEDFWHASNPSELFTNRFAKDTRPNTLTNTGANSLITIKNFSGIDNRMSFRVEFGDSTIKQFLNTDFGYVYLTNLNVVEDGNEIKFAILEDGNLLITEGINVLDYVPYFSHLTKTASFKQDDSLYVIGLNSSAMRVNYWFDDGNNRSSGGFSTNKFFSTPPTIRKNSNSELELLFGSNGILYIYDLNSIVNDNPILKDSTILQLTKPIKKISCSADDIAIIDDHNLYLNNQNIFNDEDDRLAYLVTTFDKNGNFVSIVQSQSRLIRVFEEEKLLSTIQLPANANPGLALADLRNDGTNYIIVTAGNEILAYNFAGFLADNFTLETSEDGNILISLTADIAGDAKSDLIISKNNQSLFAFEGSSGNAVSEFPISFSSSSYPVLFRYNSKICIAVIDENTILKAWYISPIISQLDWSEEYGNPQNTSFIDAAENTNRINEFFPENRAYNYPNPVYEGTTNIRYYVAEDSKISIKIFDLAGDFVAELNDDAQGGMDNETVWNVGDIQSGVYLARIEANSTSGKTEQAVIKIAVVK